jgi:hypothetical protein
MEKIAAHFNWVSSISILFDIKLLCYERALILTPGLPLSASVDDEATSPQLAERKKQLKMIVRKISPNAEPMASIESGDYTIQ